MTSVAGRLGAPGHSDTLGLPDARRYVVFLVDGMGLQLLRDHPREAPFLNGLDEVPDLVCGVPSTTAASLTSLGTGLDAGRHGVVGYTSRNPATGGRLNSLTWDASVDPIAWQPHEPVLSQLRRAGLDGACVNDARFEQSGLTLCSQRGVPFHGFRSPWERLDTVVEVVEAMGPGAVYAYESRLDHTGHGEGCGSEQWREQLVGIDEELADLRAELPSDTVLLVTADHGMVDVPDEGRFDVDAHPRLLDDVELLAGEARFRHLYTAPGAASDVADRWRAELGERAVVRVRDEGLEDWFGPVDPSVAPRIGDVVVAALEKFAVFSSREFAVELSLKGMHGSVTEAELQVPLLVAD
ncbi:MAG: alkaline phosphatase family protein [Actinomycetales bacterium]|nr:MAG: alkaline phosphatase family protein [Actinomycetales bacterium]